MNDNQRHELCGLLESWMEQHPHPDETTIFYGKPYTPRDIFNAVREGTDVGNSLGDYLYKLSANRDMPIQDIINKTIENNRTFGLS